MPYADREQQLAYWREYRVRRDPVKIRELAQRYAPTKRVADADRYQRIRAQERERRTGWTAAEYDAAFTAQRGCCALCGRHASEFKFGLVADHCHTTNSRRRLLCGPCNAALGLFRDDPSLMRRAAAYVESHATGGEQSEIEEIK